MMSTVEGSLAPLKAVEFPDLDTLYEFIIPLDTGCEIWVGAQHPKTGPFYRYHGHQIQVHRALWFYEYGIVPAFYLRRLCDPSACVAVVHRAVSACV
jgi:hypothetical protein